MLRRYLAKRLVVAIPSLLIASLPERRRGVILAAATMAGWLYAWNLLRVRF